MGRGGYLSYRLSDALEPVPASIGSPLPLNSEVSSIPKTVVHLERCAKSVSVGILSVAEAEAA